MTATLSKTTPRVLKPHDLFLVTGEMFEKELAEYNHETGELKTIKPIEGLNHKLKLVCAHSCGAMEFIVTENVA